MSSEAAAIAAMRASSTEGTGSPLTVTSIVSALRDVGIAEGDVVIAHSSLSRIGWVVGGAQTEWLATIRAEMPAFDPHLTPTRAMGRVVECFRHHPATVRSSHPAVSFAANGPAAAAIVADHPLTPGLGEGSPLSRLYDLNAKVLLIGVTHGNDTSLHLAEHRAEWPGKRTYVDGASIAVGGDARWVTFEELEIDESDFDEIGDALTRGGYERRCALGAGIVRVCRQRDVVDVGAAWLAAHRR